MRKIFLYAGQYRTFGECLPNHIEMLGEPDEMHYYNTSNIPDLFNVEESRKAPETKPNNVFNNWYNRLKLQPHIKEGAIHVILRPDVWLNEPIDLQKLSQSESFSNNAYIPTGNDWRDGVNDQLAICGEQAARAYCGLYHWSKVIYNNYPNILFHPETYLTYNLQKNGVNIIRIPQTNILKRLPA